MTAEERSWGIAVVWVTQSGLEGGDRPLDRRRSGRSSRLEKHRGRCNRHRGQQTEQDPNPGSFCDRSLHWIHRILQTAAQIPRRTSRQVGEQKPGRPIFPKIRAPSAAKIFYSWLTLNILKSYRGHPATRQNIYKEFRHLLTEDRYKQKPEDLRIYEASGLAAGRAPC